MPTRATLPIISGIPGALIENVTLSDIHIYHQGGYTEADGLLTPPEQEKVYPEPWMFGTIPAKGFYIRHARNITLDNVNFHYEKADGRPCLSQRMPMISDTGTSQWMEKNSMQQTYKNK